MKNDIFDKGRLIPLMEQFYTIQGEGYHTGKPAFFIRVGGCDIGCSWCDSKRSWDASRHPLQPVDDIVKSAQEAGAKALVVTGGEPTLYDLSYLSDSFRSVGFQTFIETAGTYTITGNWDWICLSPKQQNRPLPLFYEMANELKVIIQTEDDLIWAEENAQLVNADCLLYLQPEWSQRNIILPPILSFVKKYHKWQVSLQTHKYIGIP